MKVEIFTDGSSRGNPGPGGYGTILRSGVHYKELSEGFRRTTNNRMELLAVIRGLEELKVPELKVTIYSDSKYVVEAVEKKWVWGWVKSGFKNKKNKDLWLRFLELYKKYPIRFVWIKGHDGHPENERCDVLAVTAAESKNLKIDTFYEQYESESDQLFNG